MESIGVNMNICPKFLTKLINRSYQMKGDRLWVKDLNGKESKINITTKVTCPKDENNLSKLASIINFLKK